MTVRDDKAMGQLADSLIWPATDLVRLVHGDGDREAIGEFLSALTEQERHALPVILAAMIDPAKDPDSLLDWITWDEYGRPLAEPRIVGPRWRNQVEHGTPGMFRRHILMGEQPCDLCESANAAQVMAGIERKQLSREAQKQEAA